MFQRVITRSLKRKDWEGDPLFVKWGLDKSGVHSTYPIRLKDWNHGSGWQSSAEFTIYEEHFTKHSPG